MSFNVFTRWSESQQNLLTRKQKNNLQNSVFIAVFILNYAILIPKLSISYLLIVVLAASEMGTSGGKTSVFSHSIIFLYVSVGLSLQNGGYPISISNMITPNDHQSQVVVYPV